MCDDVACSSNTLLLCWLVAAGIFTDGRFGPGSNTSLFQFINCTGEEEGLNGCTITDSCMSSCQYPVGIVCYGKCKN